MAAEEAGAVGRAPACLCVLCGLPAAGKSTLARKVLSTAAQHGWRAGVVPYDDLITERAFQSREVDEGCLSDTHTEWRFHRQAVLQCVEHLLENREVLSEPPSSCRINRAAWGRCTGPLLQPGADRAPLLLLLDDNFYYPSMRYEVYQLARKYALGFCQLYLHCDLETCISRNRSRSAAVPARVILEMVQRMESPNPQKNAWEKNSISLNTADNLSHCDIQKVMELISSTLSNPLSPVEDRAEQTEADRLKCATSVVHQADQACRRLISDAMKTARDIQAPPEDMRSLAAELNESKAAFLHNLRRRMLQEASFTQDDDDIDTERVVRRAVDVFDRERKEIQSRIVNKNK